MSERDHFVYRVFDEHGLLLYIGCTKRPQGRLADHRMAEQPWLAYMDRVRMEGPFTKEVAREREAAAIKGEAPYFNAQTDHKIVKRRRWQLRDRLLDELREKRPEVFFGELTAFLYEVGIIEQRVDREIPDRDIEWRHARYLEARSEAIAAHRPSADCGNGYKTGASA